MVENNSVPNVENNSVPDDEELFKDAAKLWDLPRLYRDLDEARRQFLQTPNGLTSREKVFLRGLLCGNSPSDIAQICHIGVNSLRPTLSRTIYRYVEDLTNQGRTTLSNWFDVIEWLKSDYHLPPPGDQVYFQTRKDTAGLPRAATFYGRTDLMARYQDLISRDQCSVLGIFGMGGIGKTALADHLQALVVNHFPLMIWRQLEDPVPLKTLVDSFEFIPPETPGNPIEKVMGFLRDNRCLLVLDNWDSLLRKNVLTGEYYKEYECYQKLLRRMVQEEHQSCVIITSREELQECTTNVQSHDRIHQINLAGLETEEGLQLLAQYGLKNSNLWSDLISDYHGHPWALKLVADNIKQSFGGDVSRFLNQRTIIIGNGLRDRMQEQLDRLSPLEVEIMHGLTVERFATTVEVLQQHHYTHGSASDFVLAIESLGRRSLIYSIKDGTQQQLEMTTTLLRHLTKMIVKEAVTEIIYALNENEMGGFNVLKHFRFVSPAPKIRGAQQIHLLQPIALELAHYCRSDRLAQESLHSLGEQLGNLTGFELGYTLENIQALAGLLRDPLP